MSVLVSRAGAALYFVHALLDIIKHVGAASYAFQSRIIPLNAI